MNIFYNTNTKKPYPWVFAVFALVPIIVIIIAIIISNNIAEANRKKEALDKKVDIFERF